MDRLLYICLLLFTTIYGEEGGVINPSFIESQLTHQAHWGKLHGAEGDDLGAAMLYYSLIYSTKAKVCVCLGSGDGFVPRVMRQAQRDLKLENSKTILVDGNTGKSGRPTWLRANSFFRTAYPDIEIIIDKTKNVAMNQAKEWKIDYLHIDADRTVYGALQDFLDYLPYMAENGVITLHDVAPGNPCSMTARLIKEMGYPIILFGELGNGTAIIRSTIP